MQPSDAEVKAQYAYKADHQVQVGRRGPIATSSVAAVTVTVDKSATPLVYALECGSAETPGKAVVQTEQSAQRACGQCQQTSRPLLRIEMEQNLGVRLCSACIARLFGELDASMKLAKGSGRAEQRRHDLFWWEDVSVYDEAPLPPHLDGTLDEVEELPGQAPASVQMGVV